MGVSSVTLFHSLFYSKTLVFIGGVGRFLPFFPSLTLFARIPHPFQWKNVTLFRPFRLKGDRWGEG